MAKGPYQEVVYTDFSGGLATRKEDNKINDNQSPDLRNITFDGAGSFMPRHGNEALGTSTSSVGAISSTWVAANTREQIPIRQYDQYLEYYNPQTTTWENLDAGYTTNMNFGYSFYNNYTYWSNPADYQRRWNAVVWSVSAAIGVGHTSCALSVSAASALGFLSAGSIVVDGEEVYYSAISGITFTTEAFTEAHDANCAIAQLPTSAGEVPAPDGGWTSAANNLPRGSMMYEMDGQMFVTGASGVSGNVVSYSALDEPTNYTVSSTPGGGGLARYPESIGPITALNSFDEVLTVFKENTIRQLTFSEVADGSAGSIEIVSRNEIITAPKIGSINNKGLAKVENDLMYVTPSGWIKSLAVTLEGRKSLESSIDIRPTVEDYKMTSAASIYFDGKLYLACAESDATINNIVLVWDYDYRAWTKFIGWNVGDWFIYNNGLYFGASNEIRTYKVLQNFDDNSYAYETFWRSKQLDFGFSTEQKRLDQIYIEGYLTTNTTIGVSTYFDGKDAPIAKSIVGTGDYVFTGEQAQVIGGQIWGEGIYGGFGRTGEAFTLSKFRWWGKYSNQNFYNFQIKIGTASPGFVYKITHIAPYVSKVPGKRVPIASIN